MAVLFAMVYPDQATAEQASDTAKALVEAGWMTILDESLVTKDEKGEVKHHGERHPVRRGAVSGVILGGLTGIAFAVPVVGLAAGGALGAYLGKRSGAADDNALKEFGKELEADLQPGGAALVLLAESEARDRVIHDLGRHGGTLHSADIPDKQLAEIQAAIDKAAAS
jgi:uncharacterized membrane protein